MTSDLDVAVVGAGASGLAVAYALQQAGRSVDVLESAEQVGGRMRTLRHDGYLIDQGADMIGTHGYATTWKLIRQVGLSDEDVPRIPSPVALWREGRAHPNVGRPLGLFTGAGLSLRARLEMVRFNAFVTSRARAFQADHPESTPLGDMTVAELAGRYCREVSDYVFQPLVGGLFGWEAERSAAAPLVCLLLATRSTATWRTYREGMDTLARRLAEVVHITPRCAVQEVTSASHNARLVTSEGAFTARSVVLCVPAPVALDLHVNAPEDERPYLRACTYTPMLRVSCGLQRRLAVQGAPSAYGVLIPAAEDDLLSGIAVEHNKASGRAPEGRGLVSLFTRPVATRELIDASDQEVVQRVTEQSERYLPGLGQAAHTHFVHRFRYGLPEATPAALRFRPDFLRRPTRAVEYAGDWVALQPASEGAFRSADLAAARIQAHSAEPGDSASSKQRTPKRITPGGRLRGSGLYLESFEERRQP
ncbi:MAG: FAD-dependent oxidoreductase [Pseudonocardiaceae bacterium]|nr:FAD-dependent oxidoreductase [Pseudonocardiaceae bacterium]